MLRGQFVGSGGQCCELKASFGIGIRNQPNSRSPQVHAGLADGFPGQRVEDVAFNRAGARLGLRGERAGVYQPDQQAAFHGVRLVIMLHRWGGETQGTTA